MRKQSLNGFQNTSWGKIMAQVRAKQTELEKALNSEPTLKKTIKFEDVKGYIYFFLFLGILIGIGFLFATYGRNKTFFKIYLVIHFILLVGVIFSDRRRKGY